MELADATTIRTPRSARSTSPGPPTQVELRELNITPADAAVFQELAGISSSPIPRSARRRTSCGATAARSRSSGRNGVSGDWPIVLAMIDSKDGLPTLRQLLAAHRYWRRRGMMVDLVVLNTQPTSYLRELRDGSSPPSTRRRVRRPRSAGRCLRAARRPVAPRTTLLCCGPPRECTCRATAARSAASLQAPRTSRSATVETLAGRAQHAVGARAVTSRRMGAPTLRRTAPQHAIERPDTGSRSRSTTAIGGLTAEGDYLIRVAGEGAPGAVDQRVANPRGGFVVSERGAGFTWAENSYFYRLTPWHNDPVSDPVSEAIYLRDEDTGDVWSATPAPIRHRGRTPSGTAPARSTFEHELAGIFTRLTLGIAPEDAGEASLLG